jgi:hypothetical protein
VIRITFDGTDRRVAMALRARGPKLIAAEKRTLNELMRDLQMVIHRKLSGEVLKSHGGGGSLLASVRQTPTVVAGSSISGSVQAGGGLLWWAVVHEEGGEKEYEIPKDGIFRSGKKALAFFGKGAAGLSFGRTAMTKLYHRHGMLGGSLRANKFGAFAAAGGIVVRHVIHPPLPKRSFMESSLLELRGRIIQRVYETAAGALR